MRPRVVLARGSCVIAILVLGACGGSGDEAAPDETTPGGGSTLEELWRAPGDDVAVIPGSSSFEPGRNRVVFLVVDPEGRPVTLPSARVWVSRGLDEKPFLETTADLERIGVPGGAEVDATHIYVANVPLGKAGKYWFVAEPEGGPEPIQALGNIVVQKSISAPGVGDPAPISDTPTLASVGGDASKVTTRVPPDLTLVQHSVAETVRERIPFVVTFSTPKFCASRVCGPVVDVVEEVLEAVRQRRRPLHPRRGLRGQRSGQGLQPLDAGLGSRDGAVDVRRRREREDREPLRGARVGARARSRGARRCAELRAR